VTKATILSIEDDKGLQFVVKHFLEEQGYNVLTGNDGRDLIEKVRNVHVDVILLDLILPDSDGLNLMTEVRQHSHAPIIVVSGKGEPTDKILGLELGADDYIGKPFEMRELYARIKAVLRRYSNDSAPTEAASDKKEATKLKFGKWILDRAAFKVTDAEGNIADLTTAEFRILEILLNAAGRVLSRDQLFELARGHDYQSYDRAIDIHIARLRKKLGDNPKTPELIKTIRGVGYMLCADVAIIA
jgi:two-component system, OmpR family, response regulator